jgi:hypothetical protein
MSGSYAYRGYLTAHVFARFDDAAIAILSEFFVRATCSSPTADAHGRAGVPAPQRGSG